MDPLSVSIKNFNLVAGRLNLANFFDSSLRPGHHIYDGIHTSGCLYDDCYEGFKIIIGQDIPGIKVSKSVF